VQVPTIDVASLPADPTGAEGPTLLDVREIDEWVAGHAPAARHLPMSELLARADEIPAGELVVVCRSGARSAAVTGWLVQQGRAAANLDGGMHAWAAAGRPMVSETGRPPAVT